MKTFWWRGGANTFPNMGNFGDELTPALLKLYGVETEWVPPADAGLVAVGSILDMLPDGWAGTVCGAGKRRESDTNDLSQARILALRGPLSAERTRGDVSQAVLADPGLLAPRLLGNRERTEPGIEVGVIPHWSDSSLTQLYAGEWIDVRQPPARVVAQIARCKRIVTSSLHGLIVADAFGIPATPILCYRVHHEGGDFKFRDYSASVGVPLVFERERTVSPETISHLETALHERFASL